MSNGIELVLGCLIVGIFIGILISNTASSFSVEMAPNNILRASVAFN